RLETVMRSILTARETPPAGRTAALFPVGRGFLHRSFERRREVVGLAAGLLERLEVGLAADDVRSEALDLEDRWSLDRADALRIEDGVVQGGPGGAFVGGDRQLDVMELSRPHPAGRIGILRVPRSVRQPDLVAFPDGIARVGNLARPRVLELHGL